MSDRGETLTARLASGPLSLREAELIVDDVLLDLERLHERGLVDRAVTAERVVIQRGAEGPHARLREAAAEPHAKEELVRTRFAFLAPEQVRARGDIDARADVYAVGVLAFLALTSKLPFTQADALSGMVKKLEVDPPTLESVSGKPFSPLLELFVATAMATDRERRYPRIGVARAAWRVACESAAAK